MTAAEVAVPVSALRRAYSGHFRDTLYADALMWRLIGDSADEQRRTFWTGPWCSLPSARCWKRAAAWDEVARDWAVLLADTDPADEFGTAWARTGYKAARARHAFWVARAEVSA